MQIKMLCTVRPDIPSLSTPGTVLRVGQIYEATANKSGAICGVCENGKRLGVKPAEFEFVSLPEWLFDIWVIDFPYSVEHAMIEEDKEETE